MAAAAEDVNADNEHTIEQRSTPSSPPSTPSKADEVLYCHFIPKKEFVEKGTPWIIHTSAKCYVCATVNFESMAMMRTAGPGGEAPDPVVCKCGVSRHHLRLEGYVSMSQENTPHPVATIRSHRESTLANVPAMEQKLKDHEASIKELNKKNKTQALKLKGNHEDNSKLRGVNSEWKKKLAEQSETLSRAQTATRAAQTKVQQKELLLNQMQQQLQALREGGGNGGGGRAQRKQQEKAAAKHQDVQNQIERLQAEAKKWRAQAESQGVARGRLQTQVTDLRHKLEQALTKAEQNASRPASRGSGTASPSKRPRSRSSKKIRQKSLSASSADATTPEASEEGAAADGVEVSTDSELDIAGDSLLLDHSAAAGVEGVGVTTTESAESASRVADESPEPDTVASAEEEQPQEEQEKEEAEAARWLEEEPAPEVELVSPPEGTVSDTGAAAAAAGGGETAVAGSTLSSQPADRPPVKVPPSGPPVTIGAAYTTPQQSTSLAAANCNSLDGRGVTAADLMRQRQQRRAATGAGAVGSQANANASSAAAASAAIAGTWGAGRSTHGLAKSGAVGLRGPSSTGANLHNSQHNSQQGHSQKNWGGNPFGSGGGGGAAGAGLSVSGVVMGRPAVSGANGWHPIIAGGVQFRGRRR
eukprot:COSAG06_NODE_5906_length_3218_cov_9.177300_2_plen_646_part_00